MKNKSIISIEVNEFGETDIRFEGSPRLHLALLGSLDLAKEWIKKQILTLNSVADTKNSEYTESKEVEVSKSEAVNYYLEKRESAENAMKAIVDCDDQAKFKIKLN